ncbi:MAG: radical SAM protein [Candidatus Zixiibacteriota bacterium]|nr:MAG: radical SAM protein [candidate division Zixibacteria bacterium]
MSGDLLNLQTGLIYGPINSRRLGSSLGINLLPTTYKACPFNCAYCQYGFTSAKGYTTQSDGSDMPDIESVTATLDEALEEYPSVAYITFSGNGEPTLHPEFGRTVDEVKKSRDKLAPEAKVAILCNSSLVFKDEVREALARLDVRIMKLDAGDEGTFRRFSRPHKNVKFEAVVAGLKRLDDIIIQALFAGGEAGNYNDFSIEKWIEKIGEIRPNECHIYSIDRPSADGKLTLIDRAGLLKIKEKAEKQVGVTVKVY